MAKVIKFKKKNIKRTLKLKLITIKHRKSLVKLKEKENE